MYSDGDLHNTRVGVLNDGGAGGYAQPLLCEQPSKLFDQEVKDQTDLLTV